MFQVLLLFDWNSFQASSRVSKVKTPYLGKLRYRREHCTWRLSIIMDDLRHFLRTEWVASDVQIFRQAFYLQHTWHPLLRAISLEQGLKVSTLNSFEWISLWWSLWPRISLLRNQNEKEALRRNGGPSCRSWFFWGVPSLCYPQCRSLICSTSC